MKKFLVRILQFIPFGMISYIIFICIWGNIASQKYKPNLIYKYGSAGHTLERLNEIKKESNIDILFLGSSHAYRGFDTSIFNKHKIYSFNLGTTSQTPFQTKILIDYYLDQLAPNTIIIEVYPWSFCADGLESSLDIITNSNELLLSTVLSLKQNHIKSYNTFIYSLYNYLFNRNVNHEYRTSIGKDQYIKGGYVRREIEFHKNDTPDNNNKWEFQN